MSTEDLNVAYESEAEFRLLADWALRRRKNAWVTSLDVFERELGINRMRSVKLARRLQSLGCARYIEGRRLRKSRVEWSGGLWSVVDAMTKPH